MIVQRFQFAIGGGAIFLLLCLFLLSFKSHKGYAEYLHVPTLLTPQPPKAFSLDKTAYEKLNLTKPVRYGRIDVNVTYSDSAPDVELKKTMSISLPELHDLEQGDPGNNRWFKDATLVVPAPEQPPNLSHILFGVATKVDRLLDAMPAFAHWAKGARMIAYIQPAPAEKIEAARRSAEEHGFTLEMEVSNIKSFSERYFSLMKYFYESRTADTKWVVFMDDDTFFPSMNNVVRMLDKYDASKPQYVGTVSEWWNQVQRWGLWGFGGAGIFISMPLLEQIRPHMEKCMQLDIWDLQDHEEKGNGGDVKLGNCIFQHTLTKLSLERGLHQLDIKVNASGFYESGRPLPLSLHHWHSWHDVDVVGMMEVSKVCGTACLMHRWKLADGWFLTNGYSIVKYSEDRPADDIVMEKTWPDIKETGSKTIYSVALDPLRPKDVGKQSYRMHYYTTHEKSVNQWYVKHGGPGQGSEVIEIVWSGP